MKKIVALLTGLLLLSSCRSVSYDDLNPTIQPNDNLLPVLEIETDASMYPRLYTVEEKHYKDFDSHSGNARDYTITRNRYEDPRIRTATNIFIKEVQENIIEQTGHKKGYIKMRVTYLNNNRNGFYSLAKLPLYIPVFLGIPCGNSEYTTEVEVTIMDKQKNIIKRYTEKALDEEFEAMYWGYDEYDAKYKASMVSLKKALENIRHRINNDAPEIRAELK